MIDEVMITAVNESSASDSDIYSTVSDLKPSEELYSYAERVVIGFICLFVCIFGSVGNTLVIIAVLLSRKLQTPPNAFVVSLATADLLTSLFLIWNVVALLSPEDWPLPNAKWLCTLAGFINVMGIGVSLFCLAAISLNRYILITKPYKTYQRVYSPVKIGLMVILIWIYHFGILLTLSLNRYISFGYDQKYHECSDFEHNDSKIRGLIVTLAKGINLFLVLAIVIFSYAFVFRHVRRHFKRKRRRELNNMQASSSGIAGEPSRHPQQAWYVTENSTQGDSTSLPEASGQPNRRRENTYDRKDLEVTKNLFIIVAVFFLCFMPYCTLLFFPGSGDFLRLYGVVLIYSNSSINPVIYACRHPHFKVVFRAMIQCQYQNIPEPTGILKRLYTRRLNPQQ
ncbi:G-protein coupled receptor moody-like [Amphiura filiformis]|uniref:G-protein coupled receptor moody-like n=1 Tax=Amphiura filiformis TaxID=82378 RepID=UPI003B21DD14